VSVLTVAPWSSFAGSQRNTTTRASNTDRTRPYCTICKGTDHTNSFCHHSDLAITARRRATLSASVSIFIQSYYFKHDKGGSSRDFFPFVFSQLYFMPWQLIQFKSHLQISSTPCSDWVTASAPVSIRWFLCLSFFCCLRYFFSLDFRFWCLMSYDFWFYHIIFYHQCSDNFLTRPRSWHMSTSSETDVRRVATPRTFDPVHSSNSNFGQVG